MTNKTDKTVAAKPINIAKLVTDADFTADAALIHKRVDTVQNDIHRHLYAIAFRWNETGDVRPAVKRVNALLDAMPKGIRTNAIRAWVEAMLGFEFVEKAGDVAEHFKAGAVKGSALPMDTIINTRWFDFTKEAPYKPLDFGAELAKLLKKAGERVNSTKGDAVPAGMLDAVSKAVAAYQAEAHAKAQAGKLVADPLAV
jgi:hypothetical protein